MSLQDQIREALINHGCSECRGWEDSKYTPEATQAILDIIDSATREAVIEELKLHAPEWCEINEDGSINPRAVYDRIAQLQEQSGGPNE